MTGALCVVALLVDLNHADAQRLLELPDMTPTMAQAIVQDRAARGPFADETDVGRVPGVGADDVARWLPCLVVEDTAASYRTAVGVTGGALRERGGVQTSTQGFLHAHVLPTEAGWSAAATAGWRQGAAGQGAAALERAFVHGEGHRWGLWAGSYHAAFGEHLVFGQGVWRHSAGISAPTVTTGSLLAGRRTVPPLWGGALRLGAAREAPGWRATAWGGTLGSQESRSTALLGAHVAYAWDDVQQLGVTAYGDTAQNRLGGAVGVHGRVGSAARFVAGEWAMSANGVMAAALRSEVALSPPWDVRVLAHHLGPGYVHPFAHPVGTTRADVRVLAQFAAGRRWSHRLTAGPGRWQLKEAITLTWEKRVITTLGGRLAGDFGNAAPPHVQAALGWAERRVRLGTTVWFAPSAGRWHELSAYAHWRATAALHLQARGGWRRREGPFAQATCRWDWSEVFLLQARYSLQAGQQTLGFAAELRG